VADDDHNQDQPESPSQWEPPTAETELPNRLRVHSLARVLGTTSKRVLDALAGLDGRTRSPQSSVDQAEAIRVREALAAADAEFAVESALESGAADPAPVAEPVFVDPTAAVIVESESEPESRLILETHPEVHAETPHSAEPAEPPAYLPLFVAPQPVAVVVAELDEDDAADDEDDDADDVDGDAADRPANRRRRRGRRGRGRGRGEPAGADGEDDDEERPAGEGRAEEADDAQDGDEAEAEDGDEESPNGEGATRRRRRRRRRRTGGGGDDGEAASPDDPPNTVVHERAPRTKAERSQSNEIQGISGSTRLEAKRQRRRDGRDAGRRRPPILTEAEFLARREAVDRVMVVRDKVRTEPPHEGALYTQIAVLEDGIVVEHFVTSAASASLVGNIYLGIVQNVLPSMEAAFVDIGRGRNGVLYAGEVNWEAAGLGGANRKIEQALKPGDYVVVQVSKDPVGHKGARLTTQVSLAGRYLVYVPGASSTGISRKLPDTERQRLKEILREVVPPEAGVIIRTASEGVKEDDIRGDVTRLQERWNTIAEEAERVKANKAGAAIALYEEPDVLVKVIRDLFNEDFSGLIVSGDHSWETITAYVDAVAPELLSKLTRYDTQSEVAGPDVFAVHRIDEQLAKAMDRKVWLPSGGTLVIDRTEAMTVVDVNTGKFTGAGGNLEQTVTKNNLEAAEEIVRQLRLRDIGGIIVIDFIDMVLESNRDLVLRRLTEALARDRTRHQVSEVTSLGLIQLTRKRLGTGLIEAFSTNCQACAGRGIVMHSDPVDSAPAAARKAEAGGNRRNRRGRKGGKAEEPAVARIPVHVPGEHPMFKAMAASKTDEDEDEDDAEEFDADLLEEDDEEAGATAAGLDLDEDDEDDEDDEALDEDEDEEDDVELDEVDEDALDDIDEDESLEILDEEAEEADEPEVVAPARRPRRRAAARPAGPPALDR
jgi:ribonuclease E